MNWLLRERDRIKRVKPWLNRVKVMDRQREKKKEKKRERKEKKLVSPVHKKQERIECSWHETNETLLVWDKEWWWCQWLFDFTPVFSFTRTFCCPRFRRDDQMLFPNVLFSHILFRFNDRIPYIWLTYLTALIVFLSSFFLLVGAVRSGEGIME